MAVGLYDSAITTCLILIGLVKPTLIKSILFGRFGVQAVGLSPAAGSTEGLPNACSAEYWIGVSSDENSITSAAHWMSCVNAVNGNNTPNKRILKLLIQDGLDVKILDNKFLKCKIN